MTKFKQVFIALIYKCVILPVLFLLNPETIHDLVIKLGHFLGKYNITRKATSLIFNYQHPMLEQTVLGIRFNNPVGLAAGFDKDANLPTILSHIGFGFMEVGTITLKPYQGNPKPRLFRLLQSKGIVVNYGLKNIGANKIIKKLSEVKVADFPINISIGKTNSKDTIGTKKAVDDYFQCLKKVAQQNIGDFYTLNISCPNTFGGEPFTTADKLRQLLEKISTLKIKKPVFLKMPINLVWKEFKELLDIAIKFKINGVIIGNLNKNRGDKSIKDEIPSNIQGSISGKPTWDLSNDLIAKTYQYCAKKLIIIGVGGIFSAKDAYEKIKRGATLVQLITGMIFEGPQLIAQINRGLAELLKRDNYNNISEAVGSNHI